MLQGQPVIMELLADPSAQLTLLAPTNAGLAIEKLDDPSAVRPRVSVLADLARLWVTGDSLLPVCSWMTRRIASCATAVVPG